MSHLEFGRSILVKCTDIDPLKKITCRYVEIYNIIQITLTIVELTRISTGAYNIGTVLIKDTNFFRGGLNIEMVTSDYSIFSPGIFQPS